MSLIVVNGGKLLTGSVGISGSKNAALPILAACLLNDKPVTLHNVPRLQDVAVISEVLESLGANVSRLDDNHRMVVEAGDLTSQEPPYELVNKMRASFLVLGPLLARFGEASVPLPGGCQIGPRPVGEHLAAMEALGATVTQESGRIVARARRLVGTDINMNITSVGATENAVMAATMAIGRTVIHSAASEPEVVDLCNFLMQCGVEIEGQGMSTIAVEGTPAVSCELSYNVIPDRIEAGTYLLALIATGGEGRVTGARPDHMEALVLKLRECGVELGLSGDEISVLRNGRIKATDFRTAPYPGFPTDLQPQLSVLLTAANGVSAVTESIFEKRLSHIPELVRMGAKAKVKGDTAIIEGTPGALAGVQVEAYDLRCAAALVIAGLMAKGETRIDGLGHIVRGYEDLPAKIASLGGDVHYETDEDSGHETQKATS